MKIGRLCVLVALVLMVGCGSGGGGAGSGTFPGPNPNIQPASDMPLQGRWSGTFATANNSISGTLTLNINEQGNISGDIVNPTFGAQSNVTGQVSYLYVVEIFYAYPNRSPYHGELNANIDTRGHMVGKLTEYYNALGGATVSDATFNVDLAPQ